MANKKYKLANSDYWATDGIYDFGQSKTQRQINSDLNTAITNMSPKSVTISASSSTTLSQDSSIEVYYASNGVITVTATVYLTEGGGSSGWKDLATIPTGYRPTHNVTSIGFSFDSAGITATYVARITTGGVIRVMALPNSTYCYFNITYQI